MHPCTINKLRQISNYFNDGKIWIDTTSNILQYNWIHKNINWNFKETDTCYIIEIDGLKCFSKDNNLTDKQFSGLTFITPLNKDIKIIYKNREIKYETIRASNIQYAKILMNKVVWPF